MASINMYYREKMTPARQNFLGADEPMPSTQNSDVPAYASNLTENGEVKKPLPSLLKPVLIGAAALLAWEYTT